MDKLLVALYAFLGINLVLNPMFGLALTIMVAALAWGLGELMDWGVIDAL